MKKEDIGIGISWYSVALRSALSFAILCTFPAGAQPPATQPQLLSNAVANAPVQFDASAGLTALLSQDSVSQASVAQGRDRLIAQISCNKGI
jgi:hypothetical protein